MTWPVMLSAVLYLTGFISKTLDTSNLCAVVLRTPLIQEHDLRTDLLATPIDTNWTRLDPNAFRQLFTRDMMKSDTAWAIGKVGIDGNRMGLFVLTGTTECDHPIRYVTMHLLDGCTLLPHAFYLVVNDDHGGIYARGGRFTANNDTLILSIREGEAGAEGVDTVFTRTDWIRLAPTIDTVWTETGFEVQP
ncbi:MAG: hypothetical protein KA175_02095 [Flavobacteriales bacterium]|nr:hypothetical protein [Flavobacteriales bacterium]